MPFYAVHQSDRTVSYTFAGEAALAARQVLEWHEEQPQPTDWTPPFILRVVELRIDNQAEERVASLGVRDTITTPNGQFTTS